MKYYAIKIAYLSQFIERGKTKESQIMSKNDPKTVTWFKLTPLTDDTGFIIKYLNICEEGNEYYPYIYKYYWNHKKNFLKVHYVFMWTFLIGVGSCTWATLGQMGYSSILFFAFLNFYSFLTLWDALSYPIILLWIILSIKNNNN